jgi:hypothetical protein
VSGRIVLVTAVGAASGSRAAAAALACAGSEVDRAGLLIDVGGRPPRPTLVASAGARELEERLALHLPELRAAARGQTCHLAMPAGEDASELLRATVPLVRDSVAVIHLPPDRFRAALGLPATSPSAVLLRVDLAQDRALAALAVGDLIARGLPVAVLKRPLTWIPSRRALFGVLPPEAPGGLSKHLIDRLLQNDGSQEVSCYGELDDSEVDTA